MTTTETRMDTEQAPHQQPATQGKRRRNQTPTPQQPLAGGSIPGGRVTPGAAFSVSNPDTGVVVESFWRFGE